LSPQLLHDTSSGQEKLKLPVPTSCVGERSHIGQASNRARGQKGSGASGATALHPPQALILLCCQDSTWQEHSWHNSPTSSSRQPRICESCPVPGKPPCEAGGRILPWPQPAITHDLQAGQMSPGKSLAFPQHFCLPARSRAFVSKGPHNSVLQTGRQVELWLAAQLTPVLSQPVVILHASGVFLRHLPKLGLV